MNSVSNEIIEALQVLREGLESQAAPNTTVVLKLHFQKLVTGESRARVSYCLERTPKKAETEIESAVIQQEQVVVVPVESKPKPVLEVVSFPKATPAPVSAPAKEPAEQQEAKLPLVF